LELSLLFFPFNSLFMRDNLPFIDSYTLRRLGYVPEPEGPVHDTYALATGSGSRISRTAVPS